MMTGAALGMWWVTGTAEEVIRRALGLHLRPGQYDLGIGAFEERVVPRQLGVNEQVALLFAQ